VQVGCNTDELSSVYGSWRLCLHALNVKYAPIAKNGAATNAKASIWSMMLAQFSVKRYVTSVMRLEKMNECRRVVRSKR